MLHIALIILQFASAACIIALVLIQRGKGADAGAGFGAGASGTVFGARGASTALSRATAIFAAVFMINSLALTYMSSHTKVEQPKTILDTAGQTQPAPQAPAAAPALGGTAPGAGSAAAPAAAGSAPAK